MLHQFERGNTAIKATVIHYIEYYNYQSDLILRAYIVTFSLYLVWRWILKHGLCSTLIKGLEIVNLYSYCSAKEISHITCIPTSVVTTTMQILGNEHIRTCWMVPIGSEDFLVISPIVSAKIISVLCA